MSENRADPSEDLDDDPIVAPERPPIDSEMDITPMIDMTFLLLIFFVLTSKMTGEKSYEIPPAKNGSLVPTKSCVSLIVSRGSGEVPIVANGDGVLFSDDPDQQFAEIGEYVQLELESGRKTEILIRAEGNVTAGQLYKVKQAIAEVIEENKLLHIAVQEVQ
ncbi:MAG: biopolymer transporter ExbD [Pirellula sp.]|jgi:biopolymer transport protein ExbD|nr:biopolymer transporter ExbD [Pirellula sp.]